MDISEYTSKKEKIDKNLKKIEVSISNEIIKIKKNKRNINKLKKKQYYNNIIKTGMLLSEALPPNYDQQELKQYLALYKQKSKGDDNHGMDT